MAKTTKTKKPNNEVIKDMLKQAGIKQWQLAKILLVSENTVYRALREPLDDDKYNLYVEAIKKKAEDNKAV